MESAGYHGGAAPPAVPACCAVATLILLRHGQSVANAERRFTIGPHEPLTEQGRAEARAAARLVQSRHRPVAVYASPFVRALETARLVGEPLGFPEPETVEDLREQSFGDLHGRPYTSFRGLPEAERLGRWHLRPPGGETLLDVARRAGTALDAIARRHAGCDVVVVSHGGVMAALRGHATRDFETPPVTSANAAGYLLRHDGTRYAGPLEWGDD